MCNYLGHRGWSAFKYLILMYLLCSNFLLMSRGDVMILLLRKFQMTPSPVKEFTMSKLSVNVTVNRQASRVLCWHVTEGRLPMLMYRSVVSSPPSPQSSAMKRVRQSWAWTSRVRPAGRCSTTSRQPLRATTSATPRWRPAPTRSSSPMGDWKCLVSQHRRHLPLT